MFINVIIFCILHSMADALFHHHHHSSPSHTRIHVCLTPPNTMLKVQKHIKECQHEVKNNIFNEAFSLIHEHAFKHPHDPLDLHSIGLHDDIHDDRNLTHSEQEILKFFEDHDHFGGHVSPADSFITDPHMEDHHLEPLAPIPSLAPLPSIAPLHAEPPIHYLPPWHRPYPDHLYKKTDSIRLNTKTMDEMQRAASSQASTTTNRNPYQYFNINNGEAMRKVDRQRRDLFKHLHKDHHHTDESMEHDDHHTDTIYPTAIDYKDKRIAGCLMHCLYVKDHAIDPHTGYPTLDGLVNFYSDGVHEHGFFMTTLRAVDYCLKGASHKYHINRHVKPLASVKCDLAFDIFDCVSDRITEYCSKHHYHEAHYELKEHLLDHFEKHKDHYYYHK